MKIVISTHQGNLYNEEVDYVVVKNNDGQFAIMKDHVSVVCVIKDGYVKLVRGKDEFYVAVSNGILEYHQNLITVLSQEAHIGKNVDSAKEHLASIRQERLNINRKETADFTQKEKELVNSIHNSKAGQL